MKTYLITLLAIISVVGLILLSGCPSPPTDDKLIPVTINTNEIFEQRMQIIKTQQMTIPGFEYVFDSIYLDVTNQGPTSTQYFYLSDSIEFNLSLPRGYYNFYMYTSDPDTIEAYPRFTTNPVKDSITYISNTITLPVNNKQSLILIPKTNIEGSPTVQCGNKIGIMSIGVNYYFIYVLSDAIVVYNTGGEQRTLPIKTVPRKVFIVDPATGKVRAAPLFDEIIYS